MPGRAKSHRGTPEALLTYSPKDCIFPYKEERSSGWKDIWWLRRVNGPAMLELRGKSGVSGHRFEPKPKRLFAAPEPRSVNTYRP